MRVLLFLWITAQQPASPPPPPPSAPKRTVEFTGTSGSRAPPPVGADVSRVCDTPFGNGGLCAMGSSSALSPARSDSARARRLSSSPASGSCAEALPDLPGVVARVDEVEAHPLLDGQIAHARVLHKQISAALGQ